MSRITKEIASIIAKKMTAKQLKKVNNLGNNLRQRTTDYVKSLIPNEVIEFNSKFPGYIDARGSIQLEGNGWDWQRIDLTENLPTKLRSVQPEEKLAVELKKMHNNWTDENNKLQSLKQKLENLLYSLRTYSKVNLEFPEATPYLPEVQETGLAINISDIRNELNTGA